MGSPFSSPRNCKLLCPGMIDKDNCWEEELKVFFEEAKTSQTQSLGIACKPECTSTPISSETIIQDVERQEEIHPIVSQQTAH